jgi:hypothetical protein
VTNPPSEAEAIMERDWVTTVPLGDEDGVLARSQVLGRVKVLSERSDLPASSLIKIMRRA